MTLCIGWLAKQQSSFPSLILNAIESLGQEFTRRFNHPDSSYLSAFDHVFNEVYCLLLYNILNVNQLFFLKLGDKFWRTDLYCCRN